MLAPPPLVRAEPGQFANAADIPAVSRTLLRWFSYYCRRYAMRHFHAVRLSRFGQPSPSTGAPLVVFCNHASWWDPIVGLLLRETLFPQYTLYAPIEAAALARYGFLQRLGFFGVDQGTLRGARQFLRSARAILSRPDALLAITAQGRFADSRERPVVLQPGLGHLACHGPEAVFVPVALEYVFWEERLPELLVRFGPQIQPAQRGSRSPESWTQEFERALEDAQDGLAQDAQRRDPAQFDNLLWGGAGQGGVYDTWRAISAWARGKSFVREHGIK